MPIFIVAYAEKTEHELHSVYEVWGSLIHGPTFHVEIAVVRYGQPVHACSITYPMRISKYGIRDYGNAEKKVHVTWYLVPGVDEDRIESFCESMDGKCHIDMLMMARSAMPIEDDDVTRMALRVPAIGGLTDPKEIEEMVRGTEKPITNGEYCASLTFKCLKAGTNKFDEGIDPTKLTAHDIVVLARRVLGAEKCMVPPEQFVSRPAPPPRTTTYPTWYVAAPNWHANA